MQRNKTKEVRKKQPHGNEESSSKHSTMLLALEFNSIQV